MILKNKKADEKLLSFYWIIIFVLIAVCIASAVFIFSKPFDVRQIESKILNDKIIECLVEKGQIKENVLSSLSADGSNLEQKCSLIFSDSFEAYGGKNQFYLEIKIADKRIVYNKDNSEDYSVYCNDKSNSRNIPICSSLKIFVLDSKKEMVLIEIISVVRKIEQNV